MKTMILTVLLVVALTTTTVAQRTDHSGRVKLKFTSIQISGDTLLLNLKLENRSLVSYDWNGLRVYAKDRHIPRRTAIQEMDIDPLVPISLPIVCSDSTISITIAYDAFTVPHDKFFFIQTSETSNSRALTVRINGRRFMRLMQKK